MAKEDNTICFTVKGEPKGKSRPRFDPRRKGRPYTPAATVEYERSIAWEYRAKYKSCFQEYEPLRLSVKAYFKIPGKVSKEKRTSMLMGRLRPVKKPDADNIIKCISDALNGVAYKDDSQIVEAVCEKYYSDEPRVEVSVGKAIR